MRGLTNQNVGSRREGSEIDVTYHGSPNSVRLTRAGSSWFRIMSCIPCAWTGWSAQCVVSNLATRSSLLMNKMHSSVLSYTRTDPSTIEPMQPTMARSDGGNQTRVLRKLALEALWQIRRETKHRIGCTTNLFYHNPVCISRRT